MSRIATAAKAILSRIDIFSRAVIRLPLRNYQVEPLTAVVDSILNRRGLDFLIVMPRQSGKNELVAHLLVYLLNIFQRVGGQIVFGAEGDGVGRMATRLEDRLENAWNAGKWGKAAKPTRRTLGKAAVAFLSTNPQAASRGETAHWLLIIDEMQDQDAAHIEQVFEPMRAANNATAVYIGTVKFTHDALWQKKLELEREQERDGRQRVFFIYPDRVTQENPAYQKFLAAKEQKFGRTHPIVASEYYLEPVDGSGGMFPPRRQALMKGSHARQHQPTPGRLYVALLDVAGQDEAATDPIAALKNPGRDYTACTIIEVILPTGPAPGPTYHAVDIFIDHGSRHFEDFPGRPKLVDRLLAFIQHWGALHLVSDATGIGEGVTSWLTAVLSIPVTPFKFTGPSKAQLGSGLISIVETARLKYWSDEDEQPESDGWWFWRQVEACSYDIPPNGRYDRDLKWEVKASHKTPTPSGPQATHDDRLLSAALVAILDDLHESGQLVLSTGESAVIPPADPMAEMSF